MSTSALMMSSMDSVQYDRRQGIQSARLRATWRLKTCVETNARARHRSSECAPTDCPTVPKPRTAIRDPSLVLLVVVFIGYLELCKLTSDICNLQSAAIFNEKRGYHVSHAVSVARFVIIGSRIIVLIIRYSRLDT